MKKKYVQLFTIALILVSSFVLFQNFYLPSSSRVYEYYFPPSNQALLEGPTSWEKTTPESAGWSTTGINNVIDFLANGIPNDSVPDICGTNTTAFIVLHKGKIITEWYNDKLSKYYSYCKPYSRESFTQGQAWDVNTREPIHSSTKSVISTLVGIAIDEGKISSVDDPVSKYLGDQWTCIAAEKDPNNPLKSKYSRTQALALEKSITIRNLLTMTSGVGGGGAGKEHVYPYYVTTPGAVWFYNTSLYHQVINLISAVNGQPAPKPDCSLAPAKYEEEAANITKFAKAMLFNKIGMLHSDFQGDFKVMTSSARDMARFGLFILSGGSWKINNKIQYILNPNNQYLLSALNSYQLIGQQKTVPEYENPSYGYLWWLNGKHSYMGPGIDYQACHIYQETGANIGDSFRKSGILPDDLSLCKMVNANLIPSAPDDLVAALGAFDKKIYIVPSLDLVVVRHGTQALPKDDSSLAVTKFDELLWEKIMKAKLPDKPIPPKITAQPQSVTVKEGEMAIFRINATGTELKYQWFKNNKAITGANSSQYSFKATATDTGAKISCKVSNAAGSVASNSAVLTVLVAPKILAQPRSVTVKEGEMAIFRINATGTELKYQWFKNNKALAGANLSQYSFKATATDTGAKFSCKVNNAAGSVVSSTAVLTVTVPPKKPNLFNRN